MPRAFPHELVFRADFERVRKRADGACGGSAPAVVGNRGDADDIRIEITLVLTVTMCKEADINILAPRRRLSDVAAHPHERRHSRATGATPLRGGRRKASAQNRCERARMRAMKRAIVRGRKVADHERKRCQAMLPQIEF